MRGIKQLKVDRLTNKVIIDSNTGEIHSYLSEKELKYIDNNRNNGGIRKDVLNDKNKKSSDEDFYRYINSECGSFYFTNYTKFEELKYIFRFIYLCTFMNYKNYLEFGNAKDLNILTTKKDLFEILRLSKRETYNTINYLLKNKLIEEVSNKKLIKINTRFCKRGSIHITKNNKGKVCRMFDNAIKELYEKSKAIEHEKLGLLIKLLPMIHFDKNIVCKNPSEEVVELIEPLNLTNIAKELGYSTTQKLKKALFDMRINEEKVIMIASFNNVNMIVVNPRLYYKGTKMDELKAIIDLFIIANKY